MNSFSRVLKTMRLRSFDRWTKSSMLGGLEGAGRLGRAFKQLGGGAKRPNLFDCFHGGLGHLGPAKHPESPNFGWSRNPRIQKQTGVR